MPEVLLTITAKDDLMDIWGFLMQEAGADVAGRTLIDINKGLQELAGFPEAGKSRDDICDNLRSFVFRNYVFYYFPRGSGIEVYRILHSARDISWILYQ
jgi:toxin ParE1/3/4